MRLIHYPSALTVITVNDTTRCAGTNDWQVTVLHVSRSISKTMSEIDVALVGMSNGPGLQKIWLDDRATNQPTFAFDKPTVATLVVNSPATSGDNIWWCLPMYGQIKSTGFLVQTGLYCNDGYHFGFPKTTRLALRLCIFVNLAPTCS